MKPAYVAFDASFEKKLKKYRQQLFKILDDDGIYLIEIGDHDACY